MTGIGGFNSNSFEKVGLLQGNYATRSEHEEARLGEERKRIKSENPRGPQGYCSQSEANLSANSIFDFGNSNSEDKNDYDFENMTDFSMDF